MTRSVAFCCMVSAVHVPRMSLRQLSIVVLRFVMVASSPIPWCAVFHCSGVRVASVAACMSKKCASLILVSSFPFQIFVCIAQASSWMILWLMSCCVGFGGSLVDFVACVVRLGCLPVWCLLDR